MELSRARVVLRPRNPWESMDLGLIMLRAWRGRVYRAWLPGLALAAMSMIIVLALLDGTAIYRAVVAAAVLWWLKPLLDRPLVAVFSRSVFGSSPSRREAWAIAWRGRAGWLWQLTLGRIDPVRAFHLPVWMLEAHTVGGRRDRFRVLDRGARGHALALTLVCLALELIVFFGLFAALLLLVPALSSMVPSEGTGLGDLPWPGVASVLGYALTVAVVEPFYVGAGFALYLNRRTLLEGWDIEIEFRRLRRRIDGLVRAVGPVCGALAMLGALSFAAPVDAFPAEPVNAERLPAGEAAEVMRTMLDQPPFTTRTTQRALAWKNLIDGSHSSWGRGWSVDLGWLAGVGRGFAQALEAVLWVAAIAVGVWLAARVLTWASPRWGGRGLLEGSGLRREQRNRHDEPPAPGLPDDPAGEARGLLRRGRIREAVSLLYRAGIGYLLERGYEVADGATESEVLAVVRGASRRQELAVQAVGYLEELVGLWQGIAYAARVPAADEVEPFCARWRTALAPSEEGR